MPTKQLIHPMVELQQKVSSLVNSKIIKPTDPIGKIALLFGDEWSHWKSELNSFEFSIQDPICDLLVVEAWDEE